MRPRPMDLRSRQRRPIGSVTSTALTSSSSGASVLFKDKRILVAGATGLIGSHLTKRLLAEGARVRATHWKRDIALRHPALETMRVDLTKGEDCRRAVRDMESVFLCAASSSGAATIQATPMVHVTPNVLI